MAKLPPYDERSWRRKRAAFAFAPDDEQRLRRQQPQRRLRGQFVTLLLWLLLALVVLRVFVWDDVSLRSLRLEENAAAPKRLQQRVKTRLRHGDNHANDVDFFSSSFCSPDTLDAQAIAYNAQSRLQNQLFYTKLQGLDPPFPPPVFENTHRFLCQEAIGKQQEWTYCLPIAARKDVDDEEDHLCTQADRLDLLADLKMTAQPICYASVLHMILVDVYEELRALGAKPALLYGTLLGAVRNESIIPHTEDGDIGYQLTNSNLMEQLTQALWRKGYHVFHHEIPRVCVAPTHPLASNLYDPTANLVVKNTVPYVDLYKMTRQLFGFGAKWEIEFARRGWHVPNADFQPYSQVRVRGQEFDTVADPLGYLIMEYSADFMTPRPRT